MPKIGVESARRRALIVATIDAIHERGLGGVTVGDIARRAGVSAALAHHYFGSKADLLTSTMQYLLADLARDLRQAVALAGTPRSRLDALIAGNFAPEQFRPAVISAWLAFYTQAQHDAPTARLLEVYLRRIESNLVHELKQLVPAEAARRIARGAAALVDGLWLRAALPANGMSPAEALKVVQEYIGEMVNRHAV